MAMPNEMPPFNDKRVRQALNYAVDKEAINKALYGGLAVTMTSPLPEAQWGFDKSLKGYPYDPAKAKQLLAAAGVKPGLKVELLTYNTPRGYNPAGAGPGGGVAGLSAARSASRRDMRKLDMGAFLATVRSGKYHGHVPDRVERRQRRSGQLRGRAVRLERDAGERHLALQGPGGGQADGAGGRARRTTPSAWRCTRRSSGMILDDAPWVFVNSTLQVRAIRKNVKGFQLNPTQMFFDMDQVSLTK